MKKLRFAFVLWLILLVSVSNIYSQDVKDQIVDFFNVKIGISKYDDVNGLLNEAKEKYFDISYYNGYWFNINVNKLESAYFKKTDDFINYDKNNKIKSITGFFNYSKEYNKVPFQMLFFDNILFKLDIILIPGFIDIIKNDLDNKYGNGKEMSYQSSGRKTVYGYSWEKDKMSIYMILSTGIYMLSKNPEYFLSYIDDKIKDYKRFYINFVDKYLQDKFYSYKELLENERKKEIK